MVKVSTANLKLLCRSMLLLTTVNPQTHLSARTRVHSPVHMPVRQSTCRSPARSPARPYPCLPILVPVLSRLDAHSPACLVARAFVHWLTRAHARSSARALAHLLQMYPPTRSPTHSLV
ncbi:uncharacterized protein B0H18DRAFT_250698 [Fomitopsis serialis]|uniref:uncharacterized protein n=1 Tax=Fomitopsis serialis TaxID=139415 RepID=UPI0020089B3D|nr:uncharacterized protein B0H18DRAFT_250698 [Neoantrodia serialis]KAH9912460.1 hypothetical protein B0H18DRAFT_250698 [Neoantrodia serialis]